jgi:hypothetical protein
VAVKKKPEIIGGKFKIRKTARNLNKTTAEV